MTNEHRDLFRSAVVRWLNSGTKNVYRGGSLIWTDEPTLDKDSGYEELLKMTEEGILKEMPACGFIEEHFFAKGPNFPND